MRKRVLPVFQTRPAAQLLAVVLALCAAAVVSPVLRTPLSGDDAFNSYLDGWALAHHASLFATFAAEFREWDVGRGRFIPALQIINVAQFHVFHAAWPLKLLQVTLIALNIVLLYATLLTAGCRRQTAVGGSLIAILMLQSRSWYDPIAQYNLHLPAGTMFALAALLFMLRYRCTRAVSAYVLSAFCFAIASLTYEIFTPIIFPLCAILFCCGSVADRLRTILPFATIVMVEFAAVATIRHVVPQPPGAAYSPNVGSTAYLTTVWRQTTAALPFAYILGDPQAIFRNHPGWWHLIAPPTAGATLSGIFAAAGAAANTAQRRSTHFVRWTLGLTGATLAVTPAMLLASSPFYQMAIKPGLPYIPVYAQGFGIAFLGALGLEILIDRKAFFVSRMLTFAAGCGCGFICAANIVAMNGFAPWGFARDTIVGGLAHADMAGLPSGSLVFLDDSFVVNDRFERDSVWNNIWFYRLFGGRVWQTRPLAAESTTHITTATEFRSLANTLEHGAFVLQRIERAADGLPAVRSAQIVERGSSAGARPELTGSAFRRSDFASDTHGDGWSVFNFSPHCRRLPPSALVDNSPSVTTLEYNGFSVREQDGETAFRWGGPVARLVLRNATKTAVDVRLAATLQTAGSARGVVAITRAGVRLPNLGLSASPVRWSAAASVPAKSVMVLELRTRAPNVALPGDSRDLRIRLSNVSIADTSGCAAADATMRRGTLASSASPLPM